MLVLPHLIVSVYLDVNDPANQATVTTALGLLVFAALFQVADGVQVIAFGSLRGLKDTKVPMLIASVGYWGIGFVAGWALAFRFDFGPRGRVGGAVHRPVHRRNRDAGALCARDAAAFADPGARDRAGSGVTRRI